MKEIKKYDCDITIVIGGTEKWDDINFDKFNLKINGLDLKPGRPLNIFMKNQR